MQVTTPWCTNILYKKIAVSKVLKIWQNRLKWGYGIRDPGAKKPSS
jgi:hypothetical protein